MLTIWTKCPSFKTYTQLSSALKAAPELPTRVVSDFSVTEDTKVILALGSEALQHLQASKSVPRNLSLTKLRNRIIPYFGKSVLLSYSPDIGEVDWSLYVDVLCDTASALRLYQTGSLQPKLGSYRWLPDFSPTITAIQDIHQKTGQPVEVTLDLEWVGKWARMQPSLQHPGAYTISVQITHTIGFSDCVFFGNRLQEEEALKPGALLYQQLQWLLTCPWIKLGGANLKGDLEWIWFRTGGKEGGIDCSNFVFDTTIVGSLIDENRSNGLDVHTKIYAPAMGGYCVIPDTRLWRSNLRWTAADDIEVGDGLVGFDEHCPKGHRRKLQYSVVTSKERLKLPCAAITTSRGTKVVVSYNHAWLVKGSLKESGFGNLVWCRTDQLKVGQRIKRITDVVQQEDTFNGGWVSGFLESEGHLYQPVSRIEVGWAQKPGKVWDKAEVLIGNVAKFFVWDGKSSGVKQAKASTFNALKIMQAFRPTRLMEKLKLTDIALPQEEEPEYVAKIEWVGEREVVSLRTTTHTFVAEGLASHNSDEFDATVNKERMDLVPKDKLLPYAGGDTDACHQVRQSLRQQLLANPGLTRFYVNILHPASRAFEVIERGGIYVSKEAYAELRSDLDKELLASLTEAKKILGGRIVAKHWDSTKYGCLNINKASLLIDYLFSPMGLNLKPKMYTEGSQEKFKDDPTQWKIATSEEHLMMFSDVPEAKAFLDVWQKYQKADRVKGTYVDGFLEHLREDSCFHPWFFLYVGNRKKEDEGGAVTGRLSAKKPAFQTIPKHHPWAQRIRRCFIAPPGFLIGERDFSQGELRIMACLSHDPNMLAAYKANRDLHSETAGPFRGFDYDKMMEMKASPDPEVVHLFEEVRQLGKAGNFGLIYKMSWQGFQEYARTSYGVHLSDKEAQDFRNGFFAKYPQVVTYQDEYIKFAHQHGYVVSPLGRVRHLPLINSPISEYRAKEERRAVNSPDQATLSDMMIWSLALEEKMGLTKVSPCFGVCHDAGYNYIPEDQPDRIFLHTEVMENLPFHLLGWQPELNFPADAQLGKTMGDMEKVKKPQGKAA